MEDELYKGYNSPMMENRIDKGLGFKFEVAVGFGS